MLTRANLNKNEVFLTNTTTASKYIPRSPRICTNWNLFQTPNLITPYLSGLDFWNLIEWDLKGGISIDADSGPPRYVLWCCGGICHQVLTFFQIGCGHTVIRSVGKIIHAWFFILTTLINGLIIKPGEFQKSKSLVPFAISLLNR